MSDGHCSTALWNEKKVAYLAGPMTGFENYNAEAFNSAATDLRGRGYRVINPVELDLEAGFDPSVNSQEDFDLPAAIRRDVDAILECDLVVMLPGHETSKGATAERHVAVWKGIPVFSYPSMVSLPLTHWVGEGWYSQEMLDDVILKAGLMQQGIEDAFISIPPKTSKRFKITAINHSEPIVDTVDGESATEPTKPAESNECVGNPACGEWPGKSMKHASRDGDAPGEDIGPPTEAVEIDLFEDIAKALRNALPAQLAASWARSGETKPKPVGRDHHPGTTRSEGSEEHAEAEPRPQAVKDGDTVTNDRGGSQSHLSAAFDCIPPECLRLLAQCLGFGKAKYGKGNWKNIDQEDNIAHAMNHLNEYRRGDKSEPHLVNAMARVTFALSQAVTTGDQPADYIHPDTIAGTK